MQRHLHSGGDLQGHGRVDVMSDMSRFDAERLHQLIANHARYTGSTRAREILENWEAYAAEVPQGDAGRIPARAGRAGGAARANEGMLARRGVRGSGRGGA